MEKIEKKFEETKYYLSLLSIYLKNSYGIKEQIDIMTDIFRSLDNFYEDYVKNLSMILDEKTELGEDKNDFLEKLGTIFNCSRTLSIPYTETGLTNFDIPTNSCKSITLSNEELLIYIKASIVKYNFNGTMEELNQLYNAANKYTKLNFTYLFTSTSADSLTCNIYFNNYLDFEKTGSKNIRNLFLNHILTIESMGICYNLSCQDVRDIGVFGLSVYCASKPIDDSVLYNDEVDFSKHFLVSKLKNSEAPTDQEFNLIYFDDENKKQKYNEEINAEFYKLVKKDKGAYGLEVTNVFKIIHDSTDKEKYLLSLDATGTIVDGNYLMIIKDNSNDKIFAGKSVGCFIIGKKISDVETTYYIAGSTKLGRFSL